MDRCDQLRLTTSGSARAPTVHASNDGGDANIGDASGGDANSRGASTLASDCLHRPPPCHPVARSAQLATSRRRAPSATLPPPSQQQCVSFHSPYRFPPARTSAST